MKILVTGNKGYIGSVLTKLLVEKGHDVVGLDTEYFRDCGFSEPSPDIKQIKKDVRDITLGDFKGIDAVIHLAALSNDPLSEFDPSITRDINYRATLNLANIAKGAGIKRFVYASSQGMYGFSQSDDELDEDNSEKNPLTIYAKTKWEAECELKKISSPEFTVICFRPSTVFGASPKLRCDIVYNSMVACAYTTGKIELTSSGNPWRPVVHIQDVCNAFIAGLVAPVELVAGQSFNIGIQGGNYRVQDLAEAAQKVVPGSEIIFTGTFGVDSRTYRISFNKILTVLVNYYKPRWDLYSGGKELVDFFRNVDLTEEVYRGKSCNRLANLKYLVGDGKLNKNLFWNE